MSAVRVSPNEARRLGVKLPKGEPDGIKLRGLQGAAGLDTRTEHEFQSACVEQYRRALTPPADVIAVPNQRYMNHLSPAHRASILRQLEREGTRFGASDTLYEWDPRHGAASNLGHCWVEKKRAINPEPLKQNQLEFILARRAMGKVAGFAQCVEHVEALLDEAGAPLRWRSPPRDVAPWWAPLGEFPPLYGNFGGVVRLPSGATLRIARS